MTDPNRIAMVSRSFLSWAHLRPRPAAILSPVRVYTRTGDDGTTGLFYGGRVSKSAPAPEAYGSVDEAVALLGLARALASEAPHVQSLILRLQRELFVVGADLA